MTIEQKGSTTAQTHGSAETPDDAARDEACGDAQNGTSDEAFANDASPAAAPESAGSGVGPGEGDAPDAAAPQTTDTDSRKQRAERRTKRGTRHLIGYSRFLTAVPCVGLLIAAVALTVSTLISTVLITVEAVQGHVTMQEMLVEYIEYADFFLLGVVLYIMSVGLYALFIDDETEMPAWLEIHTLDDLKEKLIGVLGVVIGVNFLGRLIHGTAALDLALIGIGSAAVVMALAYFVKHVISSNH